MDHRKKINITWSTSENGYNNNLYINLPDHGIMIIVPIPEGHNADDIEPGYGLDDGMGWRSIKKE